MRYLLLLGLSFCLSTQLALAGNAPLEGLVNLQASANAEVKTDTIKAIISVEAEHSSPAALASNINKKITWALASVKPFKTVKVKGGQYSSYQVYNKRIFKAWRGSQTITLESKDHAKLAELIGLLQQKLLIKSLRYYVSEEETARIKQQLTQQAIANFKQQALLVTKEFDKQQYIIQQINISSNQQNRPSYAARSHMMADSVMEKSAPANLPKSSSNIRVNVNGTIRMID